MCGSSGTNLQQPIALGRRPSVPAQIALGRGAADAHRVSAAGTNASRKRRRNDWLGRKTVDRALTNDLLPRCATDRIAKRRPVGLGLSRLGSARNPGAAARGRRCGDSGRGGGSSCSSRKAFFRATDLGRAQSRAARPTVDLSPRPACHRTVAIRSGRKSVQVCSSSRPRAAAARSPGPGSPPRPRKY